MPPTITDIFRAHGAEYLERFQDTMPAEHQKVMEAIVGCYTKAAGRIGFRCADCSKTHFIYRGCGNRHCPMCQHHRTQEWLRERVRNALPVPHFMLTFTVPKEVRSFIRSHQKVAYSAMFKASSEAIKQLAKNPKYMGGDLPGFFGVLHTWGRQLPYHPHIHYVVPGGAISTKSGTWQPSHNAFYLPVIALSRVYRGKFRDAMVKAGLYDQIPSEVWRQDWIVNCKAVGRGSSVLKYLAPYVFKVAISNNRIVQVNDRIVTIRYREQRSKDWKYLHLDVMEFMRRFLQHVLPTGFMKIRYYGFMNANCQVDLDTLRTLAASQPEFTPPEKPTDAPHRPPCSLCGGTLVVLAIILPRGKVIVPRERWIRAG